MNTDLSTIKTKSGKTIEDFQVPAELQAKDPALVILVLKSESMDDGERQYWFNLWSVMNEEQIDKLRDILTREKEKLAAIEAKYAKKPELSPEEAAARNKVMEEKQRQQKESLAQQEAAHDAQESGVEDDLLSELENL
mgnify:CR=1 FL=1